MKKDSEITILMVDDEPDNLQAIADAFNNSGFSYTMLRAPNGEIALKISEKKIPDLIITDWDMPIMDGIEFIKQLRSREYTRDIPVIMCTGAMIKSENLQTALEAGAYDYIRKPIDRIELIARTSSMLKLAESFKKIKKQHNELKTSYKKIEQISRTDPLTQLSNRRDLMEKIEHEKARVDRKNGTFVLALGDIDKFKNFNDKYGHDCGDFVLVSVANQLKKMIRQQDFVCRWGGEEFLMLFPDTDLEGGRIVVEKIRREIEGNVNKFKDLSLRISLTFGICVYDQKGAIDQYLKHADEALYKGKQSGRNKVVVYQKNKEN